MKLGVLIFGQRMDPHLIAVSDHLQARGVDVKIFDQYRDQTAVTYRPEGGQPSWPWQDWIAAQDGVVLWSRVKLPIQPVREEFTNLYPRAHEPVGPYQTKEFYRAEWRVFRRALIRAIVRNNPHVVPINAGDLFGDAGCKPLQLQVAHELGLTIPHTVIGNCEATIRGEFGPEVLFKPLSSASAAGRGYPPVAMLPTDDVLADGRATVAPTLLQERVPKAKELRIHVVGESIRVIEIDSQSVHYTKLDWRLGEGKRDLYSIGDLPEDLRLPLLEYMRQFELDIGVFDFAVRPDGVAVFFECNPAGQFLGLERFTSAPISQDVADLLVSRCSTAADRRAHRPALSAVG